jgi:predicted PhzF superfamily epimerase YddE/YHI9
LKFVDCCRFTPAKEIYICGHATLAAAHALFSLKEEDSSKPAENTLAFVSRYQGQISATKAANGGIQFSFQAEAPVATELSDTALENLTSSLAIERNDILYTGRTATDLVVELSRSSFSRISQIVDYSRIASLGGRGLVITCLGKKRVPSGQKDDYHCVSCGGHAFMNDTTYDYLLRGFFPR